MSSISTGPVEIGAFQSPKRHAQPGEASFALFCFGCLTNSGLGGSPRGGTENPVVLLVPRLCGPSPEQSGRNPSSFPPNCGLKRKRKRLDRLNSAPDCRSPTADWPHYRREPYQYFSFLGVAARSRKSLPHALLCIHRRVLLTRRLFTGPAELSPPEFCTRAGFAYHGHMTRALLFRPPLFPESHPCPSPTRQPISLNPCNFVQDAASFVPVAILYGIIRPPADDQDLQ